MKFFLAYVGEHIFLSPILKRMINLFLRITLANIEQLIKIQREKANRENVVKNEIYVARVRLQCDFKIHKKKQNNKNARFINKTFCL